MSRSSTSKQSGFSLVELLVAMLISLVVIVIMMKLFADSESAKRNVSSGGDAQSNGAIALYSVTRDLRLAGYGLTADDLLGCKLMTYNSTRTPTSLAIDRLAPVTVFPAGTVATVTSGTILPAGDSNTDIIMSVAGNSSTAGEAVGFNDQTSNATYGGYLVKNRVGFQIGDLAIAAESGKNCALLQVSALPGSSTACNVTATGSTSVVKLNTDSFLNPYANCAAQTSAYNQSTAPVTYSASDYAATLSNVGPAPTIMAYAIRDSALTYCNLLTSDCSSVANWSKLAANIVGFKVLYGWDTSTTADGYVDEYSATVPSALSAKSNQCQISRVGAVRVGLVARNGLADKVVVTSAAPVWQGGSFVLSAFSDWQYYRYKVFETTIPLRNMIWKGAISGC
jgi:type IV pilus assembly protein PilW